LRFDGLLSVGHSLAANDATGLPQFEMSQWLALMGPAHLPKEVVNRLSSKVSAILKQPDVMEILPVRVVTSSVAPQPSPVQHLPQERCREMGQAGEGGRHLAGVSPPIFSVSGYVAWVR
jgi:hypothetical protein